MKLGNFVGKNWMEITIKEAKQVARQIMDELKVAFQVADVFDEPQIQINNDDLVKSAVITIPFKDTDEYRNIYMARVAPKYLFFFLTKDSGYLEIKNEKGQVIGEDWKNAPAFSYGCSYDAKGKYISYKHQRDHGIPWCGYTYGTEIEDLKIGNENWFSLKALVKKL